MGNIAPEELVRLREIFACFDTGTTGVLCADDVMRLCARLGEPCTRGAPKRKQAAACVFCFCCARACLFACLCGRMCV